LSDRPVLPEEEAQNSVGMEQCSWGCNPPVDHNHVIFSEGSASSLNSLPEGPFTDTESWHPFTSDSLSSVTKPKGSNPHTLADQIDPEEFRKTITEELSCAAVSEEITAETLINDCLRVVVANLEDELAVARNQSHELREEVNQLKERLMQSNAEKHHLRAELGRYQFLEQKKRRNEKLLLLVRASGSEQSRPCGASSSCALRSLDGRHGTPPLQEPSKSAEFQKGNCM